MSMMDKYNSVKTNEKETAYVEHVNIEPTEKDYELGWFYRYFARQSNSINAPIYEIDKDQYISHRDVSSGLDAGFYDVIRIVWKISGPTANVIDVYGNSLKGVLKANNDSAELANKKFTGIKQYLGNLIKFWKA